MNPNIYFTFFVIFLLSFSILAVAQSEEATIDIPSDEITDAPNSNIIGFMPVSNENMVADTFWGRMKLFFKGLFQTEQTFYNAQNDLELDDDEVPSFCEDDNTYETSELGIGGYWASGSNEGTPAQIGGQCDIGQYVTYEYKDGSWYNIFGNMWYKKYSDDNLVVRDEDWMAYGIFNDANEDELRVRYTCWDCEDEQDTCEETDNGNDYWVVGTTWSSINTETDSCINDDKLKEFYCDGTDIDWEYIYCSDEDSDAECDNGQCVVPQEVTNCNDPDGNNLNTRTTASYGSETGTDYCSNNKIVEYLCVNNQLTNNGGVSCPSGKECSSGACIASTPEPVCTETDNGNDVYEAGTTNYDGEDYIDTCINGKLVEYWCSNDGVSFFYNSPAENCPSGSICEYGECVMPPATCSDTDNGKKPLVFGTASKGTESKSDSCLSQYLLSEKYCDASGNVASKTYNCDTTYNGKCDYATNTCTKVDVPEPECTDSDGGQNTAVKGTTEILGEDVETDGCNNVYPTKVNEWFCNSDGEVDDIIIDCGSGKTCFDGICIVEGSDIVNGCTDESATNYNADATVEDDSCTYLCTETDNYDDPFVKGIVLVGLVDYEDECVDNETLTEYACSETGIVESTFECSESCEDGACLESTTPPEDNETVTTNAVSSGGSSGTIPVATKVKSVNVDEKKYVVESGIDYSVYLVPALITGGLILTGLLLFVLKKRKIIKFK